MKKPSNSAIKIWRDRLWFGLSIVSRVCCKGRFWQVTMVESECSISESLSENLQKVPEKLIESYFVMVQSKK